MGLPGTGVKNLRGSRPLSRLLTCETSKAVVRMWCVCIPLGENVLCFHEDLQRGEVMKFLVKALHELHPRFKKQASSDARLSQNC